LEKKKRKTHPDISKMEKEKNTPFSILFYCLLLYELETQKLSTVIIADGRSLSSRSGWMNFSSGGTAR
jgi:hypothetical protein